MSNIALVDLDSLFYVFASRSRFLLEVDDMIYTEAMDMKKALNDFDDLIKTTQSSFDEVYLFAENPDKQFPNFRNLINPDYKGNRDRGSAPMGTFKLRDFVYGSYEIMFSRDWLETDDEICIFWHKKVAEGHDVTLFSKDKDYRELTNVHDIEGNKSTQPYCPYYWLWQSVIGDSADNVKGVPGIGPVKAMKLFEGATFDLGKTKGKRALREQVKTKVSEKDQEQWLIDLACVSLVDTVVQSGDWISLVTDYTTVSINTETFEFKLEETHAI